VLSVLQSFSPARHTRTARDLAEATSIPLPSMYRYIALLREVGLLIGDDRGAYHLSPRLISLARAAEAAESLIEFADPVMRDLVRECGETAIFVRLIARVPVCVHRVETDHHLRATFEPGQSLPLYQGATGRVLLAGLPEHTRCEYLAPLRETDPEAAARGLGGRGSRVRLGDERRGDRAGRVGRVRAGDRRAVGGRRADRPLPAGPRARRVAAAAAQPGPGRGAHAQPADRRVAAGLSERA